LGIHPPALTRKCEAQIAQALIDDALLTGRLVDLLSQEAPFLLPPTLLFGVAGGREGFIGQAVVPVEFLGPGRLPQECLVKIYSLSMKQEWILGRTSKFIRWGWSTARTVPLPLAAGGNTVAACRTATREEFLW
jgi:hypothetical protein